MTPASRLVRRALQGLYSPARADEIEADLVEAYVSARGSAGPARARIRYWREVINIVAWGLRTRTDPSAPREAVVDGIIVDLSYAARSLWRNPGYTTLAVTTLALGIGAITMIFSMVHGVVLAPLPISRPDDVLLVREVTPQGEDTSASPANYVDWVDANESFEELALVAGWGPMLRDDDPLLLNGGQMTPNFLSVVGLSPAAGRDFLPHEGEPGGDPVVMLSHTLWQDRYAGDPGVIGATVSLDSGEHTIIGIAPPELADIGFDLRIVRPLVLREGTWLEYRGRHYATAIGRLRDGVPHRSAQTEMARIAQSLAQAYPDTNDGYGVRLVPLREAVVGTADEPLWMLLAAVGFVVLIGCFNIANLMLARGIVRSGELAVFAALGASRGRIFRRIAIEGVVIGAGGGLVGLAAAGGGLATALAIVPSTLPRQQDITISIPVVVFSVVVTLAAVILSGVLPAMRLVYGGIRGTLDRHHGHTGGRGETTLRGSLVILETAVMVVLLVGAGLFLRSLANLGAVDLGIDTGGIRTASLYLPPDPYADSERTRQAVEQMVDLLAGDPRTDAAAAITTPPLSSQGMTFSFGIDGVAESGPQGPQTSFRMVSPSYFATVGVPLVAGRILEPEDRFGSAPVVVINEELAATYWPDGDAIGKRISYRSTDDDEPIWEEIVGVVGNVRQLGPGAPPLPIVYQSMRQADETWRWTGRYLSVLARAAGPAASAQQAIREARDHVVPDAPILGEQDLEAALARSTSNSRFQARLLSVLGLVAAVLAAIGYYGVLSFAVRQRVRELALRVALGAHPSRLKRSVIGSGLRLYGLGAALGLLASVWLGRLVDGLLFGIATLDLATYAGALATGAALTLLASWLPGRRASRVDPAEILRDR